MLHGVKKLRLFHEPIDGLLLLSLPLEGAKQAVPNYEGAGVILVKAVAICAYVAPIFFNRLLWLYCLTIPCCWFLTVVHPVVLRRVEHVLQRAQGVDALGVDPELEEQVELDVHQRVRRRDGQGHWQIERLVKTVRKHM